MHLIPADVLKLKILCAEQFADGFQNFCVIEPLPRWKTSSDRIPLQIKPIASSSHDSNV